MPRSDDFLLTAEELRLRKRKRLRLALLFGIVIALGLGIFFGGRPIRNEIKGWQARRHAEKAFALIEQQNWNEARAAAIAAYQLRQSEPEALRALARFLSRTRQQQALEFWEQLAKREPLTRDDRRDEVTIALVSGETERAAAAVEALVSPSKDTAPRDWLLAAQVWVQQGATENASRAIQMVLTNAHSNRREQLQATLLQAQPPSGETTEEKQKNQTNALQRLAKFAEGNDDVALDALVLLARQHLAIGTPVEAAVPAADENRIAGDTPVAPPPNSAIRNPPAAPKPDASGQPAIHSQDLIARLDRHPLAKAPQRLLAIDMRMQERPADKESLIVGAVEQWRDADPKDLAVLAMWLNGRGEFQKQLDAIPLDRALATREVLLQHVDALGALGRWDEIKRLLESERSPLEPVTQRMYLARCNAQLGNEAASKNNWQRALEAAGGDVGKLMLLAQYAEKNGALEIAESAYTTAATTAAKLRPAQQGRLRIAQSKRDTKKIHAVLVDMLRVWPNDTAIQNDEAYTRLLLLANDPVNSDELLAIEKLAESLVEREPASLPHRTLLALARLRQGRPVAALEVYAGIQATPNAFSPSALAVHAAVLSANGNIEDARNQVAQIPVDRLLPEEQAGSATLRE